MEVKLRGEHEFPVDVTNVEENLTVSPAIVALSEEKVTSSAISRITAYDFGRPNSGGYTFGLDRISMANHLRTLADRIESGDVIMQRIQTTEEAQRADYTVTALILVYHDRNVAS